MRQRIALWVIGVVGLLTGISGCAVVAVGAAAAGTVAYVEGDLQVEEPHPLDKVYTATKKSLEALHMMVIKDTRDTHQAEIQARDVEDKKATIVLSSKNEGITKISIRIGFFGDEIRSRRIYMKIHETLQ